MIPPANTKLKHTPLGDLALIAAWLGPIRPTDLGAINEAQVVIFSEQAPEPETRTPTDLLIFACADAEATVAAATVCAVVTGMDPAGITADYFDVDWRLDHGEWMRICEQTRDLMVSITALGSDHSALLATLPPSFSACVQAILESPDRKIPVLLDGPGPAAAAVLAAQMSLDCLNWVRPLQLGTTPTELRAWDHLRLDPILRVRTRLNDGSLSELATTKVNTALALARTHLIGPVGDP